MPPVFPPNFKVDTRRTYNRNKLRSKIRHVLAVASGMFPLMALFVFVMSFRLIPEQRGNLHRLAIIFVGCGLFFLMLYAWARSEKQRRREISARNREMKYRLQAEKLRQERERRLAAAEGGATPPPEG